MHERVLPFFRAIRPTVRLKDLVNPAWTQIVQIDYLAAVMIQGRWQLFSGQARLLLAGCCAEPMLERVHHQFETVFDFELAVD